MAETSEISWTDATFNPWIGCSKVSEGCRHCYAEADFDKRKGRVKWGPQGSRSVTSESTWKMPLKLNREAKADGKRKRVFCASLADVFEDWLGPMMAANGNPMWWCHGSLSNSPIPSAWNGVLEDGCRMASMTDIRIRLFDLIRETPRLDWLLLTKRPQNIDGLSQTAFARPLPPNVWIGTSVENQAAADERIPHLLKVPAKVRFLSMEPLLGPVRIDELLVPFGDGQAVICPLTGEWAPSDPSPVGEGTIDWVIVGGESGTDARPMNPDWARSLRDQCQAASVPFHFKQFGEFEPATIRLGGEVDLGTSLVRRVGKKNAGRALDGREWNEFPTTTQE